MNLKTKVMLWMSWEALTMKPGYEPSADSRMLARNLFDMFMALTMEGFTEDQALQLISTCIYTMNKDDE